MQAVEYYENYWSESGYNPTGGVLHDRVASIIEERIGRGSRCLEVGCGDAQTVGVWLTKRGYEYVGVDVSENAVRLARRAGLDARRVADGEPLPFSDASFDAVVCIEVMEHLFLPQAAAAEILRVLKPAGALIVTVPNAAYWRRRLDLALFGRWNPVGDDLSVSEPWRDPHIRFFTCRVLKRMLSQVGFHNVKVGGHGGSLARDIPLLRDFLWHGSSSRLYQMMENIFPSLLSTRVHAVAQKSPARA